jgi:D-alanyl-D-alanine carboxypeptidase (penicillin-binding protein 5/6)
MASTTKVMTAILVIEHCNMDDVVIASKNASLVPFTSLHLKPGEKVKVKDLLTAMLIRSANDTAVALAEHVAGSVPAFAKMMNDKAKEIGAKDTHFVTPNGLYAPGHYTTAYDLAMITRYALRLPEFNEIICTTSKRIDRSINTQDILIQNKSKFLKNYEGADGVKSGYIKQAGHCYVGSATRNGWRLVSVVLNSPESQADTAALMDYGFARYQKVVLARPDEPLEKISVHGGESELDVVPEREVHVAVLPGQESLAKIDKQIDDVHAPVKKGDKVGTISAYVGDRKVTTIDLRAAEDVGESTASIAWPWVRTIGFLAMLSIGVACGRTAAKSVGNGRSRLS